MSLGVLDSKPPVLVHMPTEPGLFPLKSLAFGAMLVTLSSTSAHAASLGETRLEAGSTAVTVVGRSRDVDSSTAEELDEIKRRSGLTWGQIASLFSVSRKSVHSWATGKPARPRHSVRISKLLEEIRSVGDVPAFKVREAIFGHPTEPSSESDRANREPPILAADHTPFVHQVEVRPPTRRIKRG